MRSCVKTSICLLNRGPDSSVRWCSPNSNHCWFNHCRLLLSTWWRSRLPQIIPLRSIKAPAIEYGNTTMRYTGYLKGVLVCTIYQVFACSTLYIISICNRTITRVDLMFPALEFVHLCPVSLCPIDTTWNSFMWFQVSLCVAKFVGNCKHHWFSRTFRF